MKKMITMIMMMALAFAWAGDDAPETVVASDEKGVWLGPDEIVVASGEKGVWLGPDEIVVAFDEADFALTPPVVEVVQPVVSPVNGTVFTTSSCTVSITCPTEGAAIYYSTNGRTPRVNETYRYRGPFTITDTTTVLAFAVWGEMESELVEATITKGEPEPLTLKRVLDEAKLGEVTTGGDAEWTPLEDVSAKEGGAFARSGAIGMEQTTWMETTVSGRGTLTFWWKTSCEGDPRGRYTYDHIEFAVDGETRARLDGETDWRQVSVTFESDESHVLRWTYSTDDWEEPGYQDCAWVDGVAWSGQAAPSVDATQTTAVPVPFAWLREKYPELNEVAAFEAKAKAKAPNGLKVWECYVAGLDPTDPASELEAVIEMVDGEVRISWTPNLNTGAVTRIYAVYGRTDLATGDWEPVQPWHRFFKVAVALPTGADGEVTAVSGEGFVPRPEPELGGVQLWENGPYWAECNVGATKPEEYGYYFWWGDTVGYTHDGSKWVAVDGSSSNFRFYNRDNENPLIATMWKDTSALKSEGWIDESGNLASAHDAATAHLGAPWRMPTLEEMQALVDNCTTTWTTRNGVYGRLVTGKGAYASKSIFLPAAGYGSDSYLYYLGSVGSYWSSTPHSGSSDYAWRLHFNSGGFYRSSIGYRYNGQSVRPLRGFAK